MRPLRVIHNTRLMKLAAASGGACFVLCAVADPGLIGLGFVSGFGVPGNGIPGNGSFATDVSADGRVVVGTAISDGRNGGFIWREGIGMQALPLPAVNGQRFDNLLVSDDGAVVAGNYVPAAGAAFSPVPFRWTESGGLVAMPSFPASGIPRGASIAVLSADGLTAAGWGEYLSLSPVSATRHPLIWRTFEPFGTLRVPAVRGTRPPVCSGNYLEFSQITGMSDDASVGVGFGFEWIDFGGFCGSELLPALWNLSSPAAAPIILDDRSARLISGDGQIFVDTGSGVLFRWRQGGLVEALPLGPFSFVNARAVSFAGDVIVGEGSLASTGLSAAFIWDEVNGTQSLQARLIEEGVASAFSWDLFTAAGVSPDGTQIVGTGRLLAGSFERQAYRATIRAICRIDLNRDGLVDFVDFLEFLNLFDVQDPRSDINRDGILDFLDFLAFLDEFDRGC